MENDVTDRKEKIIYLQQMYPVVEKNLTALHYFHLLHQESGEHDVQQVGQRLLLPIHENNKSNNDI